MTENNKRYQLIKNFGDYHISNGEKHICYDLCSPSMAKENWNNVVDELNELHDENEQLKSDNNRLVNETAKIVAEHQRKVFELIDEKIDELEERYKFGQEVYQGCPMHNIRFGINVLKELKKELQEND